MKIIRSISWILLCFNIQIALADDAVEAVSSNQIVFEKTAELIMQDETLTISKLSKNFLTNHFRIDVDFHFKNISEKNITRKIAFALPPVVCNEFSHSMWQGLESSDDNSGLKDFQLTIDGKPTTFTKRVEAKLKDQNISELLTKLNIPLNPCLIKRMPDGKFDTAYAKLLEDNHLLINNEPAWSENIYFEWTQTFPAGKIINIHHTYTPVVGTSVPNPLTTEDLNKTFTDGVDKQIPIWSNDPATIASTHPYTVYQNKNELRICLIPYWILYKLTTGAYWNGGIGVFKLIINDDAGAPFAINQFYTKSSPVQTTITDKSMTFVINHFVPAKDLLIQFLSLPRNPKDAKQECGIG